MSWMCGLQYRIATAAGALLLNGVSFHMIAIFFSHGICGCLVKSSASAQEQCQPSICYI
jgi:hypothetical protein